MPPLKATWKLTEKSATARPNVYGQGGLVPLHLVITNNFITNNNGVVDYGDLDNRLAATVYS